MMAFRYHSIRPGKIWLDTEGNPIHAHMPRLFFEDGIYYWYGLDKSRTTGDMEFWHWGVRYYRSRDLYNWEDLGSLIPPDLTAPDAALSPENMLLYNLIHREWTTDETLEYERNGKNKLYGFCGDYDVTVETDSGTYRQTLTISRNEPDWQEVHLK
ncbi:glycoside hydrolase family protein [Victivallis vadensis]|uniref:Glycosyl hydrolase family 43 n=1 Tax=Victivallis vadensis TaxID=172901 RepID=A0A2U1AFN1_9BACT|nr:hypothetical protein [Victivallis vadensis]PVY35193.1 hypothetical protein C8D82_14220 [Victivallis vadensis]